MKNENATEKKKKGFSLFPKKQTAPSATSDIKRFNASPNEGLSRAQVQERVEQGLVNKTGKKYSKSFFRVLCNKLP